MREYKEDVSGENVRDKENVNDNGMKWKIIIRKEGKVILHCSIIMV